MSNDLFDDFDASDDDEDQVTPDDIREVVVSGSDWTTETVLHQLERNNITLTPRFQRRDAWRLPIKSKLIESILLGIPIPQIVLAEHPTNRGQYIVLDGKQRLLTLLQFKGLAEGVNNNFKLSDLAVRADLNGLSYLDMKANEAQFKEDLDQFDNYTIRTVVIRKWGKQDILHLIFIRLNTSTVALSPQELRQALLPGHFTDFIDDKAYENDRLMQLLNNKAPDFRMRDVELLLRFIGIRLFINDYAGNLKQFLDNTCKRLNKDWENGKDAAEAAIESFNGAYDAADKVFKGKIGRKWIGKSYERRFNKAIFDSQMLLFAFNNTAEASIADPDQVELAFKQLCETDREYISSVETTTKSLQALFIRLNHWAKALATCGVPVPTIELEGGRIKVENTE